MIVNHNWLPQPQEVRQSYKEYKEAPKLPGTLGMEVLQIGPVPTDLQGRHTLTPWYIGMDDTKTVKLFYHDGENWVFSVDVLTTTLNVISMAFDFDQLGRAIVLLNTGSEVWLNFPNSENIMELVKVANGEYGTIVFDHPLETRNGTSDLIVFYKNGNGELAYRYQRDRYTIEYLVPDVQGNDLVLFQSEYTRDYRVQVLYTGVDFPIGACIPINPTPIQRDIIDSKVYSLKELPNGKILVGMRASTNAEQGDLAISDTYADVVAGNWHHDINVRNYSDTTIVRDNAPDYVIVASANFLQRPSNLHGDVAQPSDIAFYKVDLNTDEITHIKTITLYGSSVNIKGVASNGSKIYFLAAYYSEPSLLMADVINADTGEISSPVILADNLRVLTENTQSSAMNSLEINANTLYFANYVHGKIYQFDIELKQINCGLKMDDDPSTHNAAIQFSLNQAKDEIWSIQTISSAPPLVRYKTFGSPVIKKKYKYDFDVNQTPVTIANGLPVYVKRLLGGEVMAGYNDNRVVIYPDLTSYINGQNFLRTNNLSGMRQDLVQGEYDMFWGINDEYNGNIKSLSYDPATHVLALTNKNIAISGIQVVPRAITYDHTTSTLYVLNYQTLSGQAHTPVITEVRVDQTGSPVLQQMWMILTNIDSAFDGSALRGLTLSGKVLLVADRTNRVVHQIDIETKELLDGGQVFPNQVYKLFIDEVTSEMWTITNWQGQFTKYPYTKTEI